MSGEDELYLEVRDSEEEPSPPREIDIIPVDPTVAQPSAKSLSQPSRTKDGRSHWSGHKLVKGSVFRLRRAGIGFAGHEKILDMIEKAKSIGDAKYPVTGDRDAALVATYFLTGGRRNEIIKNVTRPDKDGDAFWYGLRRSDVVLDKDAGVYHVSLRILKQYETEDIVKVGEHKKLVTKRVIAVREFPIMPDEVELPAFLNWWKQVPDGQYLFEMSRSSAYKLIRAVGGKGWFVHRLRFERASFLRKIGFTPVQLMDYFLWRRIEEALRYGGTTLADKDKVLKDAWAKSKEGQK